MRPVYLNVASRHSAGLSIDGQVFQFVAQGPGRHRELLEPGGYKQFDQRLHGAQVHTSADTRDHRCNAAVGAVAQLGVEIGGEPAREQH